MLKKGLLWPTAMPPSPEGSETLSVVPQNGDTPTAMGVHTHRHRHSPTQAFTGKTSPPPTTGLPKNPQVPVGASSYRLRIGPVGAKLDGHGVEDAQLPRHLMHPPQGPLLIRVCKLHHQAGRGALGQGEDGDDGGVPAVPPKHLLAAGRDPLARSGCSILSPGDTARLGSSSQRSMRGLIIAGFSPWRRLPDLCFLSPPHSSFTIMTFGIN